MRLSAAEQRGFWRLWCLPQTGATVALIDPFFETNGKDDLRSTAFLKPSLDILHDAGLLAPLEPIAAPLDVMRIADLTDQGAISDIHDFRAAEAGLTSFGLNIPNAPLKGTLTSAVRAHPRIEAHAARAKKLVSRDNEAVLQLNRGRSLKVSLVVAADGRDSPLRAAAGISAQTIRYGQKATVFTVDHTLPHDNVSTEIHRSGGPFTLVPVAGHNQGRSAVVWMDHGAEALRRAALDADAFMTEANERSGGVLGALSIASERAVWPIISRRASALTADRMALVGEAAHVVPPIGAQGLNMSLADIACLRDLVAGAKGREEIGSQTFLAAYARARLPDMTLRIAGIDALNRASIAGQNDLRQMRRTALKWLGNTGPIRRVAMSAGLGQMRGLKTAS